MRTLNRYSDEELVALLQMGERAAFDEIYERYWDKLFITATYRIGNPHEAEDIVQDVLLKLWNNHSHLSLQGPLKNYLAVAVKYEVINRLAKQKRQEVYKSSNSALEMDLSTIHYLDLAALQNRLDKLVKALPEKCRMVFTLSREHGLSQREIAEHLQISENTVESHIKKAIKNLRNGLQHFFSIVLP